MPGEITCPECGEVNSTSRVTCTKCHSKLRQSVTPQPPEDPPEVESPPETKLKKQRKPRKAKVTPPKDQDETKETDGPKDQPKIVRRRRRKKESLSELFLLTDGKLIPVSNIITSKKTRPSPQGKLLVSLWNRNKGLLK